MTAKTPVSKTACLIILAIPSAVHSSDEIFQNGSQKLASVPSGRFSQNTATGIRTRARNRVVRIRDRSCIFIYGELSDNPNY